VSGGARRLYACGFAAAQRGLLLACAARAPLTQPRRSLPRPRSADGDKYDGEWKDDRRHGKGSVIYRGADGAVVEKYEGDWFEGKMHGHGRYVYADSGVYQGAWVDSKMCGKGTYVFPNGNKCASPGLPASRSACALIRALRAAAPLPAPPPLPTSRAHRTPPTPAQTRASGWTT